MLKVNCYRCHEGLKTPGAILLSPPDKAGRVLKEHICVNCYRTLHDKL